MAFFSDVAEGKEFDQGTRQAWRLAAFLSSEVAGDVKNICYGKSYTRAMLLDPNEENPIIIVTVSRFRCSSRVEIKGQMSQWRNP
jgi:hypothetical protein